MNATRDAFKLRDSARSDRLFSRRQQIKMGDGDVQGTDVADADGHPDRRVVGSLHSRSRHGARADGRDGQPLAATTSRNRRGRSGCYFAHTNAVENLVIFAPLVLILDAMRPFDRKPP